MPFILQDGRLVQVSDAEYEAFTGVPQATRVTTAADRRARREAEAAAAGGQNIQATDTANPANNQQIINPNTTNNTPGQKLTPVPAPLKESDIPPGDEALYEYNTQGQLQRASSLRNPRAQAEGVVDSTVAETTVPTRAVTTSSSTTTTTQTTVTGGTETVTKVTPTTYRDTSQSLALQGQADSVAAQQQARADQLRAEGKTGGQILRDPEYRRLSGEKQNLQDQAQNAKAVDQAGTVSTTTNPGPTGTVTETTVDGKFLTQDTSGYDPTAAAQQTNQFVASGGPIENREPVPTSNITEAPPIPGLDRPRGFQTDSVAFTREELNAAGITNIPDGTPIRASNTQPGDVDANVDPGLGEAFDPNFDPNAGFPALTPTVIEADPTIIQDETGAISNLRRNPETGEPYEPLPPEVDPNAGFPASLPESVSAFESGYPDPDAEIDPNAGFPPLTPASTESEVVPGFSSDPRIAGENVGSVLETPPVGLTESEVIGDFSADPRIAGENVASDASIAKAAVDNARNQQSIREQRGNNVDSADWRVRLRLAPRADYLYKAASPGILQPLAVSDGVIFPYTPTIQTVYKANYNSYNLTHSNYRGFFYQGSGVEDINITGVFTAQDSVEAAYLLAVIHFFRSVTKMFYGQDPNRGAPPPLVYLSAMGESQYVDAPCVIGQFNYNLPADVDYIRAGAPNQNGTDLLKRRDRQSLPTNTFEAAWTRLKNALPGGLPKGGETFPPAPPTLGLSRPTYVPTKMEISIILHPMQSRQQVSQVFSLKDYANGQLQPKGFW